MNRRSLLSGSVGLMGLGLAYAGAEEATSASLQDAPWLAGSSALHDIPTDAIAEPDTVQVVRVSPVLYPEFAAILIHNATARAVMLDVVRGVLTAESLPGFETTLGAFGIPSAILPPNEYWLGRLKVPAVIAVGTHLTYKGEVRLAAQLPHLRDISTLLTAIAPEDDFELPQPGEPWPIRYRNDAPYSPATITSFQQVFFSESGEIFGLISADSQFDKSGEAKFPMRETSGPTASTGGVPLGETSDRWLAQWSHQPMWTAFEAFEFGD